MAICIVEDCGKDLRARGLCANHYARWRKGRLGIEALPLKERTKSICTFEGCERIVNARGLCPGHYYQWEIGTTLRPIRLRRTERGCAIPGCSNRHDARGLCSTHYSHAIGRGEIPSFRTIRATPDGYIRAFAPGHPNAQKSGYILEHVYIMSAMLGRPLIAGETVHHINGIKGDNRPENLELWVGHGKQPKGQRASDMVDWAKELLARYEPDALA